MRWRYGFVRGAIAKGQPAGFAFAHKPDRGSRGPLSSNYAESAWPRLQTRKEEAKKMADVGRFKNVDLSEMAGAGAGSAAVKKGTILVQSSAFGELPESFGIEKEFDKSWLLIANAAEEVEQQITKSGCSFSAATSIEASAFGCDSKVLNRAVNRVLEKAQKNALEFLEIVEISRHQDAGLDYVSILARGRRIQRELASEPILAVL
jgi:hypothetical protein